MKENYLKEYIEAFFTEATAINANLDIISSFVIARSDQLQKQFPIQGYTLFSMASSYRDLSQLKGGINLYNTGNQYRLSTDNLQTEIPRLLSYVSCLTVSQVFEVFESFLKNILTECICQNIEFVELLKVPTTPNDFNSVRRVIVQLQGTNNKGFIKCIRKISPFFKGHESKNIWKMNISNWFDFITTIRHIVIHSRQNVNAHFLDKVSNGALKKLFDKHFLLEGNLLILTPYQANAIINHLYEYVHLIYKGLSVDLDLNLDFNFKPSNS